MSFNVDVFIDEIPVKTYYGVPGDSAYEAEEYVRQNMQIDFSTEEND